ncbi:MAG TPA: hypothetical protein VEV15_04735 [Flavisolibacter sp.]|nr:hypothetical protein [Flavisolibacter sp.]
MENTSNQRFRSVKSGAKKFFLVFFILLLLFGAGYFYWKYYYTYSSGNRYGLLQKFSHKGNLFKTYEGEIILSSIRGNYNVPIASEKFFFSVTNEKVANELMDAQGKFVTIHYKEKNGTLSWRGDTPYIVDSVKVDQ